MNVCVLYVQCNMLAGLCISGGLCMVNKRLYVVVKVVAIASNLDQCPHKEGHVALPLCH